VNADEFKFILQSKGTGNSWVHLSWLQYELMEDKTEYGILSPLRGQQPRCTQLLVHPMSTFASSHLWWPKLITLRQLRVPLTGKSIKWHKGIRIRTYLALSIS
jgi:hypothetical protein